MQIKIWILLIFFSSFFSCFCSKEELDNVHKWLENRVSTSILVWKIFHFLAFALFDQIVVGFQASNSTLRCKTLKARSLRQFIFRLSCKYTYFFSISLTTIILILALFSLLQIDSIFWPQMAIFCVYLFQNQY